MKKNFIIKIALLSIFMVVAISSFGANKKSEKSSVAIWDLENINAKAKAIASNKKVESYDKLIESANKILKEKNPSVMTKKSAPISGDMHDYMSLARYWWPDTTKADGMPYKNRDGRSNPELKEYDRDELGKMANYVSILSLANYLSGEKKYAKKANSLLCTWFVDSKTKMNPNFNYAQVQKGRNNNKGNKTGVLDGYSFVEMLDGVALLEAKNSLPESTVNALQRWFAEMSEWMLTSKNGIAEGRANNNHSIVYDVQIIRYAMYGGNHALAKSVIEAFPERRLSKQIAADGSQPLELRRTIAFHYSVYNLEHIIDMCCLSKVYNIDLYKANNRAAERAIDFLMPMSYNRKDFKYKELNDWSYVQNIYAKLLCRAAYFGKEKEYRAYYNKYKSSDIQPLFELVYDK